MDIAQFVLSILIFIVLFFSIGFLLNMLLRMTWVMAVIYPIVVIFIIDGVKFIDYFRNTSVAFSSLQDAFFHLKWVDITVLTSGLVGAILSGIVIKLLRKQGYQMF
ncbi:membrane protein [Bacillus coahuilensis p1.1.43]|uniref:Membrane protein n=1 Tax=Bacillus coahuilensis p1.1.43 TaxID=1150625 RepID=A0A147K697_9BACI|nr:YuiB family protein [Bacillus coahuilensis]KUP05362.1 membrane protein [Bacillus coahuilensis p1.1.43]